MNASRILALLLFTFSFSVFAESKQPNVIVILSDDQGYGDFSINGNLDLTTANLDQLANDGVQLTDFHVDPTCSPSRAALMTGKYATKVGVWLTFAGRNHMYREEVTMADVFKHNNYNTAIFGKWHLGDNYPFRPQDRGFDKSFIHGGGVAGETPDYWDNDYFDDVYFDNGKPVKTKGYTTDVWFSEAKKFIKSSKNKPFFIYLAANTPHGPFNVEKKYYQPYLDKGIPAQRARFYGMIQTIDQNVGALRTYLKENNLSENTLIVYLTDNGTSMGYSEDKNGFRLSGYNAGMRGRKTSAYEGGHRAASYWYWPKGDLVGNKKVDQLTSHIDILPTFISQLDLSVPNEIDFDGKSLTPLFYGKKDSISGRTLVVHNQARFGKPLGEGALIKNKDFSVMQDKWRLVGKELYNLQQDPSQKSNIAKQHPEKVISLTRFYDKWWEEVTQNERVSPTVINPKFQKEVVLTSQAWLGDIATYDQSHIRSGVKNRGAWYIDVEKAGHYRVAFSRWPKESNLAFSEYYQKDFTDSKFDSDFNLYKLPSHAIEVISASLIFNDKMIKTQNVTKEQKTTEFELFLPKGLHKIEGELHTKNEKYSAYYMYLNER